MENCNCHNEISFAGSGQLERYLEALDPAYVSIDGRSIEDLLVFAAGYADQIRFYDMPGSPAIDNTPAPKVSWAEFFKRDMAVIAASIAVVDLDQVKNDYDAIGSQVLANPTVELYTALFNQVVALVTKIDQWFSIAIPENPLYGDINLAINSTLRDQLKKAIAYEEGFIVVDSKTVLNIDYTKILNQQEWGLTDPVDPEFDIYQGTTPEARILSAVPYVDDIFHSFFGVISNIVDQSPGYLNYALTQYPGHQPYMTLFITFIKLFGLAQQQMNGLTAKMLNFYYRDVLHLAKKPSVPDKVFVIFQLAQNVTEYDLLAGTSLSGGKDASGKDQVYQTENDFVINQASVKELKNILVQKNPAGAVEAGKTISAIYANPVANSMDGNGAKFTVASPKWPTFGTPSTKIIPKNICEFIDQKQADLTPRNNAAVGFAIASPQLVLQGGNRLIRCRIPGMANLLKNDINFAENIQIALTGEKGWVNITRQITDSDEINSIENIFSSGAFDPDYTENGFLLDTEGILYIYIAVAEKGIIPFSAKLHTGQTYQTAYPVMQILIGPDIEIPANVFSSLSVNMLSLTVQVGSINMPVIAPGGVAANIQPGNFDGLKTLVIQTDTGPVAPGKPFDPFTKIPAGGMSFYIGSNEVFNKQIETLTVNISKSQTEPTNSDFHFLYGVNVLTNNTWRPLVDAEGDAFTTNSLTYNILYQYPGFAREIVLEDKAFPNQITLPRLPIEYYGNYDINADKGFLRIDNRANFDNDIQTLLNNAPAFQIKDISVSYLSNLPALQPGIDQFFHVYPFGTVETSIDRLYDREGPIIVGGPIVITSTGDINPLVVDANNALLPQFTYLSPTTQYQTALSTKGAQPRLLSSFNKSPQYSGDRILDQLILDSSGLNEMINGGNNQYSAQIQEEGTLFIGVEKLQPLQTLSLLFEFAAGSAVDEDDDPPAINWSYLVYNEWRPLKAENLLSDSTYGFQTTGIIKLDVPGDANDNHTIITDGLYWFCASVTANSDRIPQLIDVIAQATEAQFIDQGNSQTHFDNPLPASSISKLSVAVAQVSKVQQPFASFEGKHKEVGKEYYTRVSERLRHKGRAITAWDYEHLVLDQFPQVFKVKCIPLTDPGCLCRPPVTHREKLGKIKCCGPVKATGNVLIVPVPNLKNDNAANPLQPKTSRLTLIEIVNYLTPLTSPFVTVHAKNPVYEQVIVFFRVKFLSGVDKGYYLKTLNDEIVQYLTPWAFNAAIEADFGQKIYASAIINFIEQRPYVDFITDFLMGVCRDECCPTKKPDATKVTGKNFIAALNKVSGCNDIEDFLKTQGYFIGDVIAEPSTPMSLLVSAPHHIILLYEEPEELTPCEKRLLMAQSPVIIAPPPPPVESAPVPDPVRPTQPEPLPKPTQPDQPLPVKPTQPDQPLPVKPTQPVLNPVKPTEPEKPLPVLNPVKPTEPEKPLPVLNPVKPTEPEKPLPVLNPVKPTQPEKPLPVLNPVKPVVPEKPLPVLNPVKPVIPAKPAAVSANKNTPAVKKTKPAATAKPGAKKPKPGK